MSRRIISSAIFTVLFLAVNAWSKSVATTDQTRPSNQVSRANADVIVAATKNKESVKALIPHYEAILITATEAVEKRKELQAKGLVSKSELDSGDQAVKDAQAQLDDARRQLLESDHLMAEANAESAKPGSSGSPGTGRYTVRAAVMRYSGTGSWALTQASQVKGFFAAKFGRQLPVSALGQSETHNRLRFNHSNAVDVALHPDSAEGKALIDYLRSNGIPYLAFRSAIRGVATGAHIHIGHPSHRL